MFQKVTHFLQLSRLYFRLVVKRFIDDGCQVSAAALTYMTLFAIVPIMTVTYSMFSLFPSYQGLGDQLQASLFTNFVPDSSAEIATYLQTFSTQARNLSGFGVAILLVTSYLMLNNIERVFNRIWATPKRTWGLNSFLLYWAVLSLGPILLGAAVALNAYLLSSKLFHDINVFGMVAFLLKALTWFFIFAAFTLLYKAVPNCHVSLRNAATGGLVATLAFQMVRSLFGFFVANTSYASIYGAFAIVPMFLIWMYVCWMIILSGAEFVRASESFSAEVKGRQYALHQILTAVLAQLWNAQQQGRTVSNKEIMATGFTGDQWRNARDCLLKNKLIATTEQGDFVLQQNLEQVKVADLLNMAGENLLPHVKQLTFSERHLAQLPAPHTSEWLVNYNQLMQDTYRQQQDSLKISLAALFANSERPALSDSSHVS